MVTFLLCLLVALSFGSFLRHLVFPLDMERRVPPATNKSVVTARLESTEDMLDSYEPSQKSHSKIHDDLSLIYEKLNALNNNLEHQYDDFVKEENLMAAEKQLQWHYTGDAEAESVIEELNKIIAKMKEITSE